MCVACKRADAPGAVERYRPHVCAACRERCEAGRRAAEEWVKHELRTQRVAM